eukprot:766819-Hanusia_phi.AAC.1
MHQANNDLGQLCSTDTKRGEGRGGKGETRGKEIIHSYSERDMSKCGRQKIMIGMFRSASKCELCCEATNTHLHSQSGVTREEENKED